ncbi:hypothetical protein [Fuscibacter oryzae]|uniref:Uncharacterized protein n=1 Tax=Fuscibacter oryzae TaxID=2803939 RepID=A0A8J7MVV6_9RHOB|nr:hypothetical protein [Fuscibacter oryzae]MBL4928799.1 hypothetical protein [Fuscibacter oryzae]
MKDLNPISGNGRGLPGVLSPTVWGELRDFLTLALDAMGERPSDFDAAQLKEAVAYQRRAIRITHGAIEREGAMQ